MTTKNINDERRHSLIGLPYDGNPYDIKRYSGLSADTIRTLILENFADVNEAQNASPTIEEFCSFIERNPCFTAFGYIVSPSRDDVRVSIEGVQAEEFDSAKQRDEFIDTFRNADEFNLQPPRAWYD